jgi:hypothetical protein
MNAVVRLIQYTLLGIKGTQDISLDILESHFILLDIQGSWDVSLDTQGAQNIFLNI